MLEKLITDDGTKRLVHVTAEVIFGHKLAVDHIIALDGAGCRGWYDVPVPDTEPMFTGPNDFLDAYMRLETERIDLVLCKNAVVLGGGWFLIGYGPRSKTIVVQAYGG